MATPSALDRLRAATQLHRAGQVTAALAAYDELLLLLPGHPELHSNRGVALTQLNRIDEALASYVAALQADPRHADSYVNRGIIHGNRGDFAAAIAEFDRALAVSPGHPTARSNRAAAMAARDQLAAQRTAPAAPTGQHSPIDAIVAEGQQLAAAGDLAGALATFDRAVATDARHAEAQASRGLTLANLGRVAEAVASLEAALAIDPRHGMAALALGCARHAQGQVAAAMAAYDQALAAGVSDGALHRNRAVACVALGQPDAALVSYAAAIAQAPGDAALHFAQGQLLLDIGQVEAALAAVDRGLALAPDNAAGHLARGTALSILKRHADALAATETALRRDPDLPLAAGRRLHTAMQLAHWDGFAETVATLRDRAGEVATSPFTLLAALDDPAVQRAAAARFIAGAPLAPDIPPPVSHDRLRIGYVSADFHDHATMFLFLDAVAAHDRRQFEIHAFSYGPDSPSRLRDRLVTAVDGFHQIRGLGDTEAAALLRRLEIDIAVDLKGLTAQGRPGLFAARAAPLQVNFLGYPGTIPLPCYDYMIADAIVVPPAERPHIAEAILYLPGCYQPNCRPEPLAPPPPRTNHGLPAAGFIFACFNQAYKITPDMFAAWMAILAAVPTSVLWLWADTTEARTNLRRAASAHGIAPDRLVFAEMADRAVHLNRLQLADLCLDTIPYNAHTTASDALGAGVPMITCPGRAFASRVAASLLTVLGLADLIADDLSAYVRLATMLATDRDALAAVRVRLATAVAGSSLYDGAAFARNLEAGYRQMQARAIVGQPPSDIRL